MGFNSTKKFIEVFYSADRCGAGKSRDAKRKAARNPGLWVFALQRLDMFAAVEADILEAAKEFGTNPLIVPICSVMSGDEERVTFGVRQRVEVAASLYRAEEHVVIIITHAAMKVSDLSGYQGCRIIIDEVPSALESSAEKSPASHKHFAANYNLTVNEESGWSRVTAKADAVTVADIQNDIQMKPWLNFHKLAKSDQGLYCNLKSWGEMAPRDRVWNWYSIWSPLELSAFEAVYILGNAFTSTASFMIWIDKFGDQIKFTPYQIKDSRDWKHRKVTIRYFTKRHRDSTYSWTNKDNPEGAIRVKLWAKWIADNSEALSHYWTANKALWPMMEEFAIQGDRVSPKIAGSNDYDQKTVCSIIYSSKVNPFERTVFQHFGITPKQVIRSREYEDLIQIMFRSSLRLADDTRDVEIRVYSKDQADFLAHYLTINSFNVDVETVYTDIGLDQFERAKPGPKPKVMTAEEHAKAVQRAKETDAERKRRKRAEQKAEKIAAGTYRGKGRPRKSATPVLGVQP
ncbi:hypothetical protein ACW7BJ_01735 [Azospirillum argentinense]